MCDDLNKSGRRALVVFGGQADLAWLKLLKHGFRHCFVVVEGGQGAGAPWVICNPLSHCTEITLVAGTSAAAIAGHYRAHGYGVVETRIARPARRPAPWRPYTCVEAVKRVLGLTTRPIFTPWQLHQFLVQRNKRINSELYT